MVGGRSAGPPDPHLDLCTTRMRTRTSAHRQGSTHPNTIRSASLTIETGGQAMAEPATVMDLDLGTDAPDLDVRPLSGAMGAEVRGIDVASLDDGGFATVHALLMQYSAIALHGQAHLSDDELRAFGLRWGKLDIHGYSPTVPGYDDVLRIRSDPEHPGTAEGWHSDVSWKVIPPKISMLHARKVPSVGGDTLFCSQYRAYEDLSDGMKAFLEPLDAEHDGRNFNIEEIRRPATHPVVIRHPETGRKALRQPGLHAAHRRPAARREQRHPGLPLRALHATRYQARVRYEPGTLDLGQPLRPALGGAGLRQRGARTASRGALRRATVRYQGNSSQYTRRIAGLNRTARATPSYRLPLRALHASPRATIATSAGALRAWDEGGTFDLGQPLRPALGGADATSATRSTRNPRQQRAARRPAPPAPRRSARERLRRAAHDRGRPP